MLVSCGDAVSSQGDLGDVTQRDRSFSFPCKKDIMVEYLSTLYSPLPFHHLVKLSSLVQYFHGLLFTWALSAFELLIRTVPVSLWFVRGRLYQVTSGNLLALPIRNSHNPPTCCKVVAPFGHEEHAMILSVFAGFLRVVFFFFFLNQLRTPELNFVSVPETNPLRGPLEDFALICITLLIKIELFSLLQVLTGLPGLGQNVTLLPEILWQQLWLNENIKNNYFFVSQNAVAKNFHLRPGNLTVIQCFFSLGVFFYQYLKRMRDFVI